MYKLAAFFGSFFVWISMHFLFLSCRKYIFGHSALIKCIRENEGKVLSASWHRSMLFTVYYFRKLNGALMASRSRDGELITAVLRFFGYFAPRGSSGIGKGGQEALEVFIEHVKKGNVGGLAIDGPKGPPYVSKHGIAKAAAITGAPILLHIWYAKSNIRVNSWDRTIIPKPFSELVMIIDRKPIYVPANDSKEHLEQYRKIINTRLLHLTYQADQWFKLRDQYPDPRNIPVPQPIPAPYHPPKKRKNCKREFQDVP